MNTKFYPVLLEYVGPNTQMTQHLTRRIRVEASPGLTNMGHEPRVTGWLGTTGEWSKTALGELSEAETRALLKEYGIQIPDSSPVKFDDYSFGAETSEWYNQRFAY